MLKKNKLSQKKNRAIKDEMANRLMKQIHTGISDKANGLNAKIKRTFRLPTSQA